MVITGYQTSSQGRPLPYVISRVKFVHILGANFVHFGILYILSFDLIILFFSCYILLAIHEVEQKGGVAAGTTGGGDSAGEGATDKTSSLGKCARERMKRDGERERERC